MVRASCCDHKMGLKKGPWSVEEDQILISHIQKYGHANWRALPKQAGLLRCGKSCRLRWINYLRPDIKRGNFSPQEEETIIKLHQMLGNRWSAIAAKLPGRTDNEIKNVWHTYLKRRLEQNQIKQNPKPKSKSDIKFDNSSKTKSESGNYTTFNIPSRTQLPWQTTTPLSPPQPSSSSSSSSEASSSIIDAKTATIMDIKAENLENPWEYFSDIDQSFLSDHALSSSDDSRAVSLKFEGVFDEFQFRAPSSSIDHAIGKPDYGYSQNLDDAMEFWYDLFIKAGDGQEIVTEF